MNKAISNFYLDGLLMYFIANGLLIPYIVFIDKKCLKVDENEFIFKHGPLNSSIFNEEGVNVKNGKLLIFPYIDFNTKKKRIRFYSSVMSKQNFLAMKILVNDK